MLFVADFQYMCSFLFSSFSQNINEDLIKFKAQLCWKILLKSESSLISLHMRKHRYRLCLPASELPQFNQSILCLGDLVIVQSAVLCEIWDFFPAWHCYCLHIGICSLQHGHWSKWNKELFHPEFQRIPMALTSAWWEVKMLLLVYRQSSWFA